MDMTRNNLRAFSKDFAEAVKPLEEKYGVILSLGGFTFSRNDFSVRLTGVSGENNEDAEKTSFEALVGLYSMYGLTKKDYKKEFTVEGKSYFLVGFNPKARKNCFEIRNKAGKQYVCSAAYLGLPC